MIGMLKNVFKLAIIVGLVASCMSDDKMAAKMKEAFKKDPTILQEAINADPAGFMETLQAAAQRKEEQMLSLKS
jgi:hypothetical protein